MMVAQPPWHSIVFEAAHRMTTPVGNRSMLAAAGIMIAILSFYAAALAPALVACAGVLSTLLQRFRPSKVKRSAFFERGTSFSGALIALAWALARHGGVDHIEFFGPFMLLADYQLEWSFKSLSSDVKSIFYKK